MTKFVNKYCILVDVNFFFELPLNYKHINCSHISFFSINYIFQQYTKFFNVTVILGGTFLGSDRQAIQVFDRAIKGSKDSFGHTEVNIVFPSPPSPPLRVNLCRRS